MFKKILNCFKNIWPVFLLVAVLGVPILPVYATTTYNYGVSISVLSNGSSNFTYYPIFAVIDNEQLEDLGYINDSGLDTSVGTGLGDWSFGVFENQTNVVVPRLLPGQPENFIYRLGAQPGRGYNQIVLGQGGFVWAADHADLDPEEKSFDLVWSGCIERTQAAQILRKGASYGLRINASNGYKLEGYVFYGDWHYDLRPNGTGDYTNITNQNPGSGSHWDKVDDLVDSPDDHSTRVEDYTEPEHWDAYTLQDVPDVLANSTPLSTRVYFRHARDSASYNCVARGGLRLAGSESKDGPWYTGGTAYVYYTRSDLQSKPGGGSWSNSDLDSLQVITGMISPCTTYTTQTYVQVALNTSEAAATCETNIDNGEHTIKLSRDEGLQLLSLYVDDMETPVDTAWCPIGPGDNTNAIDIYSGPARATSYAELWVEGVKELDWREVDLIPWNDITDQTGNGHTGWYEFGAMDSDIEVTVGGISPISTLVPPGGNETADPLMLIPPTGIDLYENTSETGSRLPLFENVSDFAVSMGWTTAFSYSILMFITSISVGFGAMIATRSITAGYFGMCVAMGAASATGVFPAWIPLILAIAGVLWVIVSRSM